MLPANGELGAPDRLDLTPEPMSARFARQFVTAYIERQGLTVDADIASLLVSELVTNALLHAYGEIHVYAARLDSRLRVEVHDASDALPRPRQASNDAMSGRGLELVEMLADAWGSHILEERGESRKVVWFEVSAA